MQLKIKKNNKKKKEHSHTQNHPKESIVLLSIGFFHKLS